MRQNLRYLLCLIIGIGILLPTADAQLVNYEETWQEFLKNPKTSAISKLTEPSKDQVANYLKYCLMYANSHFCADDLTNSEKMMREVAAISSDAHAKIPGFAEKYADLKVKISAYKACGKLWIRFTEGEAVDIAELEKEAVKDAKKVCEKGTLCKYFYMTSMHYYCQGDLKKSRGHFENRVQKLVDKTSFEPSDVQGMEERVKMMKKLWAGIDKLDPAWAKLIETDQSPGFDTELPLIECYSIPNMKEYILRASADLCTVGDEMLKKIKALQKTNTHSIPSDVADKIEWLEKAVTENNNGLATLNKAWKKFLPESKPSGIDYGHEFVCDRAAEVKAYIMDGFADPCGGGKTALDKIEEIKKEHNPSLDTETMTKLKQLKARVNKEAENLAKLNEAWEDFVPDDKVKGKLDFVFEYCDKEAQIKAYVIDGTVNFCEKGKQRLEDIAALRDSDAPELADVVLKKIDNLQAKQDEADQDLADLNAAWTLYIETDNVMKWEEGYPSKDSGTVRDNIRLVKFYCDKIAQTKSWVIKGQLDPCEKGEPYLKKIEKLKADHSLSYDKELACQISRLRNKVYQCKYWTLVLKAWKITHEECERFGPASSKIMYEDLNSEESPCETRVSYKQLGKIGIQYTITTILCQKINLAQMGDPEYYKKIATWVNTEVLTKYCNTTNWRCKKDFFIYLEGHTDGHRFSGATYDKSLDVPEGTPYTHFIGKPNGAGADTLQKETRNITSQLKSNMELGIARAWTVKQQLDFMKVPITIGAYEHPSDEKDKDYRRIEIELNITNLMLDFYEKTLKELVDESGIGDRPRLGC
ncbi:hypothetical protein [Aureispira anguillae]|nr:hypothetical protein [Aureispira anguillae]